MVITNNFSEFGWTAPVKNENAITIKDSSGNIIIGSKKPNLIETHRCKDFYNSIFQKFSINNNIKPYSTKISSGDVFAERFNRTTRDLLERPVFERGDANWIDVLPLIIEQHINQVHSSSKVSQIQASLKNNERYVYKKMLDKRKTIKLNFQVNGLVITADLKKTFSKPYATNWSYKLYELTEINNDTIPNYHIDKLKEIYNESILKKTELSMKENKDIMQALNLIYIKMPLTI